MLVPFALPYVVCLCSGVGVQMKEIVCFQCSFFVVDLKKKKFCQSLVIGPEGAKHELPPVSVHVFSLRRLTSTYACKCSLSV